MISSSLRDPIPVDFLQPHFLVRLKIIEISEKPNCCWWIQVADKSASPHVNFKAQRLIHAELSPHFLCPIHPKRCIRPYHLTFSAPRSDKKDDHAS